MIKSVSHDAIDAIQNGKKTFVTIFIRHRELANSLNTFIDAQTRYTKEASDALFNSVSAVSNVLMDKNFGNDVLKSYGFDSFVPAKYK